MHKEINAHSPEFLKLWGASLGGAVGPWGAQVDCIRDILVLNKIWVQGKIYILIGVLLGRNILLIA
jgi:hypothetical protein